MSVIVSQHLPKKMMISQNADVGGWSFLQDLFETKGTVRNREDNGDTKTTTPYVHPIEKRSVAKLSLEMCTESLGTETGSESGDEISLLAFEATNIPKIPITTKPVKEMSRENSFPPPLNSLNGVNCSRMVRSLREDGRLVVQAVRVCSQPRCFVSERCEGRLRLCLLENSSPSDYGDEDFEKNEWEYDEDDAEEEEGVLGNNENSEGKMGSRKFRMPRRRCNENGCDETMLDRKQQQQQQFWVTT